MICVVLTEPVIVHACHGNIWTLNEKNHYLKFQLLWNFITKYWNSPRKKITWILAIYIRVNLQYFKKYYLVAYFWPHWVFVAVSRLSPAVVRGGSSVAVPRFLVAVASFFGAQALGVRASVPAACPLSSWGCWALEHSAQYCGAWAQLLHSTYVESSWTRDRTHVPGIGRRILITVPPGKSLNL